MFIITLIVDYDDEMVDEDDTDNDVVDDDNADDEHVDRSDRALIVGIMVGSYSF
ncbi:MAG: hypothetical protein JXA22_06990 [Candidatus Thermoplasmatota archaeon]|nr:hypothetical protein [Candidatus Thermoplasmatota archaeon]